MNIVIAYFLQDVKIDVCAILNDTTGTLMSCAWKNQNCRIGLIVGTYTIFSFFTKKFYIINYYHSNIKCQLIYVNKSHSNSNKFASLTYYHVKYYIIHYNTLTIYCIIYNYTIILLDKIKFSLNVNFIVGSIPK